MSSPPPDTYTFPSNLLHLGPLEVERGKRKEVGGKKTELDFCQKLIFINRKLNTGPSGWNSYELLLIK